MNSLAVLGAGSSSSKVFAGTNFGVFINAVGDTNWSVANTGLIDSSVTSVAVLGSIIRD